MADEVKALQQELQAVRSERDKLQQKVKAMCEVRGRGMLSSSYVLSERVQALELEIEQLQAELSCTRSERDNLKEDMMQLRNAKRLSDIGWRDEKLLTQDLERKLASAAAEEQEEHAFDSSLLRRRVERLEANLQEARVQSVAEQQHRHDLEVQLATAKQQLACTEVELQRERAAAERMQQDSSRSTEEDTGSEMQVRADEVL
jgi:chromosome segregation ATPase